MPRAAACNEPLRSEPLVQAREHEEAEAAKKKVVEKRLLETVTEEARFLRGELAVWQEQAGK